VNGEFIGFSGGGCEPYRHNRAQYSQILRVASRIFECGIIIKVFNNFMLE
jgi:hypothetical protein